jgi:hypothetical protein
VTLHHSPEEPDLADAEVTVGALEDETQSALRRRILQRARQLAHRLSEPDVAGPEEHDADGSTDRDADRG